MDVVCQRDFGYCYFANKEDNVDFVKRKKNKSSQVWTFKFNIVWENADLGNALQSKWLSGKFRHSPTDIQCSDRIQGGPETVHNKFIGSEAQQYSISLKKLLISEILKIRSQTDRRKLKSNNRNKPILKQDNPHNSIKFKLQHKVTEFHRPRHVCILSIFKWLKSGNELRGRENLWSMEKVTQDYLFCIRQCVWCYGRQLYR